MSEKIPVYLFITADKSLFPEEINALTKELGQVLAASKDHVGELKYVERDSMPKGTKSLELIFAQQAIIQMIPIVTPWILGKIDTAVKVISARTQKAIGATIHVGAHEIHITPETTSQELAQFKEIVKSAETIPNNRYALIIGNSIYSDKTLPALNSAEIDASLFAEVLRDPKLGAFSQVTTLINKDSHTVLQAIENFFRNRQRDDLLLLYFSGHGFKNKLGQLFLAVENTIIDLIRSTGVPASYIKENMDESSSQRQILILDCCYSGAIVEGAKSEQVIGQSVNSVLAFQSSGFGRVIMAASEAMQFAFDGQRIEEHTENSLFTHYLIDGLKTGKADTDNDGLVDVEELYQYAYSNVAPKQTPNISATSQKGKLFISINPNPKIQPAELPEKLQAAVKSDDKYRKQGAITDLALMLKNEDSRITMAAEMALKELASDDSLSVRNMAKEALEQHQGNYHFKSGGAHVQTISDTQPVKANVVTHQAAPIHMPVAEKAKSQMQQHQTLQPATIKKKLDAKNEILGGVLNLVIYGAGFAYARNWKNAALTFVGGTIALVLLGFLASNDSCICSGPLLLASYIWLFWLGKKEVKQYNQKLIDKNIL